MQLVGDAKNWWKWYSTHVSLIGALFSAAASATSASTSAGALAGMVPMWAVFGVAACIFVATFAGRIIAQPSLEAPHE